jgi:hypothetical protein
MDHKERVAQGQNGGTKNEEKDGRTPFAGRVGMIAITRRFAATQRTDGFSMIYCQFAAKTF